MRRQIGQFFFVISLFLSFSVQSQVRKYTFQRPKMGSPFIIMAYTDDSLKLSAAIQKAYQQVDTLNQIFSDYSTTSEISLLCKNAKKGEWYTVSAELFKILDLSLKAAKVSKGAYDVTVGNVVKLWRKARKEHQYPNQQALNIALSKTGWRHIDLQKSDDSKTGKIRFHTEGVELDFGGIVKGYAAQKTIDILRAEGFSICLADAGGDLAMGENPPNTEGWSVGISLPQSDNQLLSKFLYLKNQVVATSGDMYNYLEINGKRYSHIVNPKTGVGLTHQRNVTIIAPDGALADWLATACSVLSIKKALRLVKQYRGADLLILENNKGKIKMYQSPDFSRYFFAH